MGDVSGDSFLQGGEVVEFTFVADSLDEIEGQDGAVKVSVEVEKVCLDRNGKILPDGRTVADIDDGTYYAPGFTIGMRKTDVGGVNSVCRYDGIVKGVDIGCRKTYGTSDMFTFDDSSAERIAVT